MKKLFNFIIFFIVFFISAEIGSRLKRLFFDASTDFSYMNFDPDLGWKHNPGNHNFHRNGDGKLLSHTFDETGRRLTNGSKKQQQNMKDKRILLLGGSFTEGFGLNDDQTLAAKLEEEYSDTTALNYGVSGYGTYQSLLIFNRLIASDLLPDIVLYGYITDHKKRNSGDFDVRIKYGLQSPSGNNYLPYCNLSKNGSLECLPPKPIFPPALRNSSSAFISDFSVVVPMIKKIFVSYNNSNSKLQSKITDQIIIKLQMKAEENNIPFLMFTFLAEDEEIIHFKNLSKKYNFLFADCRHPHSSDPDFLIPEDDHPNEKAIGYFVECLKPLIEKTIFKAN